MCQLDEITKAGRINWLWVCKKNMDWLWPWKWWHSCINNGSFVRPNSNYWNFIISWKHSHCIYNTKHLGYIKICKLIKCDSLSRSWKAIIKVTINSHLYSWLKRFRRHNIWNFLSIGNKIISDVENKKLFYGTIGWVDHISCYRANDQYCGFVKILSLSQKENQSYCSDGRSYWTWKC